MTVNVLTIAARLCHKLYGVLQSRYTSSDSFAYRDSSPIALYRRSSVNPMCTLEGTGPCESYLAAEAKRILQEDCTSESDST